MGILNKWKELRNKRKVEIKELRRKELSDEVQVILKQDAIWIMVNSQAVYKTKPEDTVKRVLEKVKEYKNAILEYNNL